MQADPQALSALPLIQKAQCTQALFTSRKTPANDVWSRQGVIKFKSDSLVKEPYLMEQGKNKYFEYLNEKGSQSAFEEEVLQYLESIRYELTYPLIIEMDRIEVQLAFAKRYLLESKSVDPRKRLVYNRDEVALRFSPLILSYEPHLIINEISEKLEKLNAQATTPEDMEHILAVLEEYQNPEDPYSKELHLEINQIKLNFQYINH